jgi:catechol 2,3-dioxygenase-like lactoylglutathione lyase family enzyme
VKILGPDFLVFGIDDVDAGHRCAVDYGLKVVEKGAHGGTYEALDGTGIVIRRSSDPGLLPATAAKPGLRETRYGVADKATLQAIGAELSKDRDVKELANGLLQSTDADGYHIAFEVTGRRPIDGPWYGINVPGQPPGRGMNVTATTIDEPDIRPYTLSHVVMFTRDKVKSENFYAARLGFRTVDSFSNLGPFMRPQGTHDHHTLFLIQAPPRGMEHFTFHFAGANEVLKAGWEFITSGISTVRSAATSSSTRTWIFTMTAGGRVPCLCQWMLPRVFFFNTRTSGRPPADRPSINSLPP